MVSHVEDLMSPHRVTTRTRSLVLSLLFSGCAAFSPAHARLSTPRSGANAAVSVQQQLRYAARPLHRLRLAKSRPRACPPTFSPKQRALRGTTRLR